MEHHIIRSDQIFDIQNAGLVILNPFLLPLFENMNWCKGSVWTDFACHNKAVLATQYLVWGKQVCDDAQLELNKLICGFSVTQKIDDNTILRKQEIDECRKIMIAVVQHWSALKNTSIEGLQESFLQRNGKWSLKDGEAVLWVEKRTIDILLQQIPWGFSIIKTPWMDKVLQCNWS